MCASVDSSSSVSIPFPVSGTLPLDESDESGESDVIMQ